MRRSRKSPLGTLVALCWPNIKLMLASPDCDSLPSSLTDFVRRRFEAVGLPAAAAEAASVAPSLRQLVVKRKWQW